MWHNAGITMKMASRLRSNDEVVVGNPCGPFRPDVWVCDMRNGLVKPGWLLSGIGFANLLHI